MKKQDYKIVKPLNLLILLPFSVTSTKDNVTDEEVFEKRISLNQKYIKGNCNLVFLKTLLLILVSFVFGASSSSSSKDCDFFSQPILLLKDKIIETYNNVDLLSSFSNSNIISSDEFVASVSYENTTSTSFIDVLCPATVSSTITVPDNLIITDINIGFNATVAYRHHANVTLESPSGTIVELTTTGAYSGASASIVDWDLLFDESSANPLNDGDSDNVAAPNYENERTANPSGNLNDFNGENSSGNWILRICDSNTGFGNGGSLNSWRIDIVGNDPCTANADVPVSIAGTCNGLLANDDAIANVSNIVDSDRADISSPNATIYDGDNYANAESVSSSSISFSGLQHNTNYIVRIYSIGGGCFTDISFTTTDSPSSCPSLPVGLPWAGETCSSRETILQNGIGALTCGVTAVTPVADRWAFALMNFDNVIPASGRVDSTAAAEVYHHESWHIDSIGNVFGIAFNTTTSDILLTASSNYGAGFFGNDAIIRYGEIAGGTISGSNDSAAGGAIYKIDGVTGKAMVFASLPQQSVSFTNEDCESTDEVIRTNSGVGLGNIVYDEANNQYFASNIEDGRIYRLSSSGTILDSYDPFQNDDGIAGISALEELVYGLAIEEESNRLFFGGVDSVTGDSALFGSPSIHSITLLEGGGFPGSINNTTLPSGAVYDNYESTETFHTSIPIDPGASPGPINFVYLISDLTFNANGELLAGIRTSCNASFFSSYNHFAETNLITQNTGTGIYNNSITELDITAFGDYANEDTYGGVATYTNTLGNNIIGVSSADILNEAGPHGIAIFNDPPNAGEITPLAAVSYGIAGADPKGVGGDIELWTSCSEYDYGDLPDIADGTTGVNDYETNEMNGGPNHKIIDGLFLGTIVDGELDGVPDPLAVGDDTAGGSDDEDGIAIFSSANISPGASIRFPLDVVNTTLDTAYLVAWIDWNGDGDFDEGNEIVANLKDNKDGVFPSFIEVTVPNDAVQGSLLGFRIRLSNDDNMTPYGRAGSGEVEDYLLGISCPQVICLTVEFTEKKE